MQVEGIPFRPSALRRRSLIILQRCGRLHADERGSQFFTKCPAPKEHARNVHDEHRVSSLIAAHEATWWVSSQLLLARVGAKVVFTNVQHSSGDGWH